MGVLARNVQPILDWAKSEGHYAKHWGPGMVFICGLGCGGGAVVGSIDDAKAFVQDQHRHHVGLGEIAGITCKEY